MQPITNSLFGWLALESCHVLALSFHQSKHIGNTKDVGLQQAVAHTDLRTQLELCCLAHLGITIRQPILSTYQDLSEGTMTFKICVAIKIGVRIQQPKCQIWVIINVEGVLFIQLRKFEIFR